MNVSQVREMELGLLGQLINEPALIRKILGTVTESDFFFPSHRSIFIALDRLVEEGAVADMGALIAMLTEMGHYSDVESDSVKNQDIHNSLWKAMDNSFTSANLEFYVLRVREMSRLRTIVEQVRRIGVESYENADDVLRDLDHVLKGQSLGHSQSKTLRQAVHELNQRRMSGAGDASEHFLSGIKSLDNITGGAPAAPGWLVVLGSRPSHGKSLVLQQWAWNLASQGIPSLYVSEEMSEEDIAERSVLYAKAVDGSAPLLAMNGHADIFIERCGSMTRLERSAAVHVYGRGCKVVFVDYLQLLRGNGKTRFEQVSDVSRRLKEMAQELMVPVIAAAQLSRSVEYEGRKNNRPYLADLRESGSIEQDANVCVFPQWPWRFGGGDVPRDEYRFYCLKHRHREVSSAFVTARIDPKGMRILD